MKISIILFVLIFIVCGYCSKGQSTSSIFSHIEIIVDSTDFDMLVSNPFIRDTFGMVSYDTMQKSPLAIGYYINGWENFINFNPNKGYFASQRGSVYLIFQSHRPGQGKLLERELKSLTKDSITAYDFNAPSFKLTEIIFSKHYNLQNSNQNHVIPMLSSYSVESYKNWGLGDSSEVDMKSFIGLDPNQKKLFSKIISIDILVTENELNALESVMKVVGYRKNKKVFKKKNQPDIRYSIASINNEYKIRKFKVSLIRKVSATTLQFGQLSLRLKGKVATFIFTQ